MNMNRQSWLDPMPGPSPLSRLLLASYLLVGTIIIISQDARIARLESRLDTTEKKLAAARPVQVQSMNIHVERPHDAPKVAEGLLKTLPGFAVKRLATAKDLRP